MHKVLTKYRTSQIVNFLATILGCVPDKKIPEFTMKNRQTSPAEQPKPKDEAELALEAMLFTSTDAFPEDLGETLIPDVEIEKSTETGLLDENNVRSPPFWLRPTSLL